MEEKKSKLVCPVKFAEMPKFLSAAIMMMMTVYIYSILRASKDALIATQMGAELISAIKLYGVLPSAILFMLIYTKLVDVFSRVTLYHILNGFFVGFCILFALFLYPNAESLHLDVSGVTAAMPYLKYLFLMISKWSFSLFYIFAELWGSVMLSLMFWQLANQICTIAEAKRFYPLFGLIGQGGLIGAGFLGKFFADYSSKTYGSSSAAWQNTLDNITLSIVISGLLLSFCLWFLGTIVGNDTINFGNKSGVKKKKKVKLGFIESLKYVFSSKYIGLIALLVLCYGISINLVEGVWKKAVSLEYSDSNSYNSITSTVQIWTGFATVIAMLCGSFLLSILQWRTAAILTPVMILVTGFLFFAFMVFKTDLEPTVIAMGTTAIMVAVMAGAMQNILSKATKYSFFDPTKEMSYIPLDEELKAKGKAAADVIGGRLGKSGGAVIQQMMLILIPGSSLITLAPNMFVIFIIIMVVWIFAVFALAKEFAKKTAEHEKAEKEA